MASTTLRLFPFDDFFLLTNFSFSRILLFTNFLLFTNCCFSRGLLYHDFFFYTLWVMSEDCKERSGFLLQLLFGMGWPVFVLFCFCFAVLFCCVLSLNCFFFFALCLLPCVSHHSDGVPWCFSSESSVAQKVLHSDHDTPLPPTVA